MRHFLSMDGEAIILKETFDDEVQNAFKDNRIDVGKITKSDTGNHQASDRSPVFRDCKSGLEHLCKKGENISDKELERNLRQVIGEFQDRYGKCVTSQNANKIIKTCQKVYWVMCNRITPQKVVEGYTRCGQHVVVESEEIGDEAATTNISYDRIMNQSFCDINANTRQMMQDVAPVLIERFRTKGQISDKAMDKCGIPRMVGDEGIEHSTEVYWKGLARLITSAETVQRYKNYAREEKNKKDPIQIEEKKRLKKALATLKKNEAAEAKKNQKIEKQKAQQQEKLRRASLTKPERKAEDDAKKAEKERKHIEELEIARQVILQHAQAREAAAAVSDSEESPDDESADERGAFEEHDKNNETASELEEEDEDQQSTNEDFD